LNFILYSLGIEEDYSAIEKNKSDSFPKKEELGNPSNFSSGISD